MSASQHDLAHLLALVEAATAEATKLGPEIGQVSRLLDEAAAAVRSIEARGGRADEGLRPEQLNTENDE